MRSWSISSPHGTFSIVAADLEAGEVGCAVQSRYFSVGSTIPWVRAGVGACASQSWVVAVHGMRALDELAAGATPEQALERVLAGDQKPELRQLGIVTADGRGAAFTGAECSDWAGHRIGPGFAVQGNILVGEAVVDEMARAFEKTVGPLVDRLVAALEAGQAAGGDKRGQQSAAVVVERAGAAADSRERIDRVCDLRVEDHVEPIAELRRLVGLWHSWEALRRAYWFSETGRHGEAVASMRVVLDGNPDDAHTLYNLACFESLAGERDEAIVHVRRSIELDPSYRESARSDPDLDAIRDALGEL